MEILHQTNKEKDRYYSHNCSKDKHYYAGFFNLACINVFQVCEELSKRLQIPFSKKKEMYDFDQMGDAQSYMNTLFSDRLSMAEWELRFTLLSSYFPVAELLFDKPIMFVKQENNTNEVFQQKYNTKVAREDFRKSFCLLLKKLDELRNYYTHYYHSESTENDKFIALLSDLLLKTIKVVKRKKMKNDKTKEQLSTVLEGEWKHLFALKEKGLRKKRKRIDTVSVSNAIYNDAFHHLIDTTGKEARLRGTYHPKEMNFEGDLSLPVSKYGIVFLLSLFLSRKESENLKDKIEGFKAKSVRAGTEVNKDQNSFRFRATHWVFSYWAYKGVKRRVSTQLPDLTLLTQMVDYLSKVPNELYQNLSSQNRKQFVEDMNEYIQEVDGASMTTIVHPVIRKRYEDRFYYFALRYLDEYVNFPTLRFQLHLGTYEHHRCNKSFQQVESDRRILEPINAFGKLSQISHLKQKYFEREQESTAWQFYPNPSYCIKGSTIAIHINLKEHDRGDLIGEMAAKRKHALQKGFEKRKNNKPNKNKIIKELLGNKAEHFPTAVFSLNELPALLHALLIEGKTAEQLENCIANKVIAHYQLINNYKIGDKVEGKQLPKKLLKASLQESIQVEKLKQIIAYEIEERGEQKLQLLQKRREEVNNKTRKHVFYSKEMGEEAATIAKDIIRLMPPNQRKNWKSWQHRELQQYLAYYHICRTDALQMIEQVWQLKNDKEVGDALQKCFRKRSFEEFYEAYYRMRKDLYEQLLNTSNEMEHLPSKIKKRFLNKLSHLIPQRRFILSAVEQAKDQLLSHPMVLPRGLFYEKASFIPNKSFDEAKEQLAPWVLFIQKDTHTYQAFYDLSREYVDGMKQAKSELKELRAYEVQQHKQFSTYKKKQDLAIKKVQTRDLFLHEIVKDLFHKIMGKEANFELNDYYQTREERMKMLSEALQQSKRKKGDKSDNIYNYSFLWNKEYNLDLYQGRVKETVKLKDIGKCKRLESDKKVECLLEYSAPKVWSKQELEDELENHTNSYEKIRRESLLREIHALEKWILEKMRGNKHTHPTCLEKKGYPNFRNYIARGVFNKEKIEGQSDLEQKAELLIAIRNKFAHNQLPLFADWQKMQNYLLKEEKETYANYFCRFAQQVCRELKQELNA